MTDQKSVICPDSCRCSYSEYAQHEETPEPPTPCVKICPKIKKCEISPKTRPKICTCPVRPPVVLRKHECPKYVRGCCLEPNYKYGDRYCPHVLVQYWQDERLRFVNDQVTKKTTYKRDFIPHTLTPRDIILITKLRMKNQGLGHLLLNSEPSPSDCASMSTYQTSYNHYKGCSRLGQRPLHDFVRGLYCSPGNAGECIRGFERNEIKMGPRKCDIPPACEVKDYRHRVNAENKEFGV